MYRIIDYKDPMIELNGDHYEWLETDLIHDDDVTISLNKPLHIRGDVRVKNLYANKAIVVHGNVDVEREAMLEDLKANEVNIGDEHTLSGRLFAVNLRAANLIVRGCATVSNKTFCDGDITIRYGLTNSDTVRAKGKLYVWHKLEANTVCASEIEVEGEMRTYGDIIVEKTMSVACQVHCGGQFRFGKVEDDE